MQLRSKAAMEPTSRDKTFASDGEASSSEQPRFPLKTYGNDGLFAAELLNIGARLLFL
jgi:hypothetical protein